MTSWSKSSRRSQGSGCFCETCGKITVESHVATFGNLADMLLKINDDGLSYIDDFQDVQVYKKINADLLPFLMRPMFWHLRMQVFRIIRWIQPLFAFLEKTLSLMEEGLDYEVLTNIFEIQILSRFGVILNLHECCFCHRVGLPFDYSFRYSGVLCPDHYDRDERRAHWHPNVLYLLDRFQAVRFSELETISLQAR